MHNTTILEILPNVTLAKIFFLFKERIFDSFFILFRTDGLQEIELEYGKASRMDVRLWKICQFVGIRQNLASLCHYGQCNNVRDFHTKVFIKCT